MDRTYRGLTAGLAGGLAMNLWNLTDYYLLHITKIRFIDWAVVLATWDRPHFPLETVIGFVILNVWNAFLGALLAHLVIAITSQGLVLKSVLYSVLWWFALKAAVNFGRVPILSGAQPFPGLISNLLAIVIWGAVTGLVLARLERAAKVGEGHA